jgi:hypothetical protein
VFSITFSFLLYFTISSTQTHGDAHKGFSSHITESLTVDHCVYRACRDGLEGKKKKTFNALSVDGRVLWYGGWTKEGKKYMGCRNLTI